MSEPLERARRILAGIKYITIATAAPDGAPWNSPVYSAYDDAYNFFWASDTAAVHSRNIMTNPQVFLAVYDSTVPEGTGEGVYIQARAGVIDNVDGIAHALAVLDARVGKPAHVPQGFVGTMPRRVFRAVPERIWVNDDGERNGHFIDVRQEVSLDELRGVPNAGADYRSRGHGPQRPAPTSDTGVTYAHLLERVTDTARTGATAVVAISGFAGSGKSTLSEQLTADLQDAAVVGTDEFSVGRQAQHCDDWGSIDRGRLVKQVLHQARAGMVMRYQRYDWPNDRLGEWLSVDPPTTLLVEGIGLIHPSLAEYFDLSVWIDCPLEIASERGRLRDREIYKVDHDALWHDVWTPNDRDYFARFRPDQEADLLYAPRVV